LDELEILFLTCLFDCSAVSIDISYIGRAKATSAEYLTIRSNLRDIVGPWGLPTVFKVRPERGTDNNFSPTVTRHEAGEGMFEPSVAVRRDAVVWIHKCTLSYTKLYRMMISLAPELEGRDAKSAV
jgi:hypothetical protein